MKQYNTLHKSIYIIALFLLIHLAHSNAQKRARVYVAAGTERGWIHNKPVGKSYHQSGQATRYYGEFIYRYNGLNHLVITGGYMTDSLNFRNKSTFIKASSNGHYQTASYNTYGLIKTQSAFLGAAYLLSIGSSKIGMDFQMGLSGKYIFESIRYDMPDESYKYALRDEIIPFNLMLQPRIALRLSYIRLSMSYEMPLWDHLDHDYLLKNRPGKSRSSDMQGLRMDNPILFFSASFLLPLG